MTTASLAGNTVPRKLVMIVDDEPDMLSMLRLVLEKKCACQVNSASSGLNALELLGDYTPDVVISDIKMPDLRCQTGTPACRAVAAKNPRP